MAQSFLSLPSRSWFLLSPSSPSMKLRSPGLAHSYGQGNATKVFCNNHNCSWKTKYTLFSNDISYSPRFKSLCRVKSSEDSGQKLNFDGILFDEQKLEENLQTAIEEENYAQAAKIRDNLRSLHEDSKASVLAANARFYNSFRKGDLATMQTLWSKGENVCVVHPGVSGISGYDLVMGSWDLVWAEYDFPLEINVKDAQVHVRGDFGLFTETTVNALKWSRPRVVVVGVNSLSLIFLRGLMVNGISVFTMPRLLNRDRRRLEALFFFFMLMVG